MIDLNDDKLIKSIDKSNMLASIEALPLQCQQAWEEVNRLKIPDDYQKYQNVVVSAMGGSGLGPHIFYSLYLPSLKVPFTIINDYHLPDFVNKNTLVLLSSYSGTTEETLNCAKEAKTRGAKIIGMTTGGALAEFLKENNYPAYIFKAKYNPCNQPRMGNGYSVLGQMAIFNKCRLVKIKDQEIKELISFLRFQNEKLKEAAKMMTEAIYDKIHVIIANSFLSGNAHAFANQVNENTKNFSCYFLLPELNHHLLEGLVHPEGKKALVSIFLNSDLYEEKIKKRLNLTKEIVVKNKIAVFEFKPEGDDKLKQSLATLEFSSFVSFYLSILYHQDPSLIPWVDCFKRELARTG